MSQLQIGSFRTKCGRRFESTLCCNAPGTSVNEDRCSDARTRFSHYGARPKPPATRRDWFQSSSCLPCSNHQRRNNKQQNNVKQELRDQVAITVEHYISHLHCPLFGRGRRADFASALGAFAPTNMYITNEQSRFSPECVASDSHLRRFSFTLGLCIQSQRPPVRRAETQVQDDHDESVQGMPRTPDAIRGVSRVDVTTAMRRLRDVCQQSSSRP